jgi:outer membrane protein assembly factor BamD (BamD/ComL family)
MSDARITQPGAVAIEEVKSMLNKLLKWLELYPKIKRFLYNRYVHKSSEILLPPSVTRKPSAFAKYRFDRITGDFVVLIIVMVLAVVASRYYATYDLNQRLYSVSSDEAAFILEAALVLSKRVGPVLVAFIILAGAIGLFRVVKGWTSRERCVLLMIVAGSLLFLNWGHSIYQPVVQVGTASAAYDKALKDWNNGRHKESRIRFQILYERSPLPDIRDDALGRVAGAFYWEGNYRAAVEESCKFIAWYPDSEIYEPMVTTLHWAIYQLGQSEGREKAEQFLHEIATKYGLLCQREASPFWLGISPGAKAASDDRFSYMLGGKTSYSLLAEQEDTPWLKQFAHRYPNDKAAEYALFIAKEYDTLIHEYSQSELIDYAYYLRARDAWRRGDIDTAIQYYLELENELPESEYLADAYDDLGLIYEKLGDDYRALDYYFLRDREYQQKYGAFFFVSCDIMYILDVKLDIDQLQFYIANRSTDVGLDTLEYSLAEKFFSHQDWTAAKTKFEEVSTRFPHSPVTEECDKNITLLARIEAIMSTPQPDSLLEFAKLLCEEELIFYNELWNRGRAFWTAGPETPTEYFERNNDYLVAVNVLEQLISNYPDHSRIDEALYLQAQAYEKLGNWSAFLPHQGTITVSPESRAYRDKATEAYSELISRFPGSQLAERSLQRMANIYLSIPYDFQRARETLRTIADTYPQHNIANNSLNWIAWTYAIEANLFPTDSPEYVSKYQQALAAYEEIVRKYPDGHIGDLARQNVKVISEKLIDPAKRVPLEIDWWLQINLHR